MLGVRSGSLVQSGSQVWCVNVAPQSLQPLSMCGEPSFYPHDCEYISCTFTNEEDEFYENNNCLTCAMSEGDGSGDAFRRFTNQVFMRCTFIQERVIQPSWCVFMKSISADSNATFENCAFTQHDDRELIKNELQVSSSELVLAFDTCTFDSLSEQQAQYAFLFKEASYGQCSIGNSTFITDFGQGAAFADNESGNFDVLLAGNTIHGH